MLYKLVILVLLPLVLEADFSTRVDNTNFTVGSKEFTYNYDRVRFRADYFENDYFFTVIGDGVNYYGEEYLDTLEFSYLKGLQADTPLRTQSDFYEYENGSAYLKLYRLYGGYENEKNRIVFGLQNISMGVGRIWTPTNLFNPTNIYSLEPDETFGVLAFVYTRHIDDMSQLTVVASQKEDKSFKYGARYKGFYEIGDFACNIIVSDETKMLGFEFEANLGDSGVEVRSETAYIKQELQYLLEKKEDDFVQGVIGADYGFVNGITLIAEVLYSSKKFSDEELFLNYDSDITANIVFSNLYTALSMNYSFNIFLDSSLTYIESFNDDNSRFVSPTLIYTMNDYNTFTFGAQIVDGNNLSEFGRGENRYFLKWGLSF